MAETTYPGQLNTFRDEWPGVAPSDGILQDFDGSAFGMTTSGSSPEVTITPGSASQPVARYRVAGFTCALDAPKTLDLSAVGTNPTAGQKRVDRIVARYDWSLGANAAAAIVVKPGTPVSVGAPDLASRPVLTQVWGDVYELPLRWVSRPSGGVVTASGSERLWHTYQETLDAGLLVDYAPAPIGCIRTEVGGRRYHRQLVGGNPTWARDPVTIAFRRSGVVTNGAGDYTVAQAFGSEPLYVGVEQLGELPVSPFVPTRLRVENVTPFGFTVKLRRTDTGAAIGGNAISFMATVIL